MIEPWAGFGSELVRIAHSLGASRLGVGGGSSCNPQRDRNSAVRTTSHGERSARAKSWHITRPLRGDESHALNAARESCARSFCTFPEESINGDSIEVVRQE